MSERISNREFVEVLKDTFDRGQDLIFTPSGVSMLPMLDGKTDKVTFSVRPKRLKKYDVLFYIRPSTGQLVLHRLVGFGKDGTYVFSGDGQYYLERGVRDEDIIAIMSSFTHRGKRHEVNEVPYNLYIRMMMIKKMLRIAASKMLRLFKK